MGTYSGEEREEGIHRLTIWLETFEPEAQKDWQAMKGWEEQEVADLLAEAKAAWDRYDVRSQHAIAARAHHVGLSPLEYLAVFITHVPDTEILEEREETAQYLAQQQEDGN